MNVLSCQVCGNMSQSNRKLVQKSWFPGDQLLPSRLNNGSIKLEIMAATKLLGSWQLSQQAKEELTVQTGEIHLIFITK